MISSVLFESYVDAEYAVDEPAIENSPSGKRYPVTIKDVKFRGHSIERLLHVSHVMLLQRRLYFMLLDGGHNG